MSSHARFEEWASRSLDGELTDVEHRELQEHVRECTACRLLEGQFAGLKRLLREDAQTTGSVGLSARIWARVEAERRPSPHARSRPSVRRDRVPLLRRSAALAAGVLVLLGAFHAASLPDEALAEDPVPKVDRPVLDPEVQKILEQRPQRQSEADEPSLLEILLAGERR